MKKQSIDIKLTIYCASYSENYNSYYDELVNEIFNLELTQIVNIDTNYYSDKEIISRLSNYELIVFPYQFSSSQYLYYYFLVCSIFLVESLFDILMDDLFPPPMYICVFIYKM